MRRHPTAAGFLFTGEGRMAASPLTCLNGRGCPMQRLSRAEIRRKALPGSASKQGAARGWYQLVLAQAGQTQSPSSRLRCHSARSATVPASLALAGAPDAVAEPRLPLGTMTSEPRRAGHGRRRRKHLRRQRCSRMPSSAAPRNMVESGSGILRCFPALQGMLLGTAAPTLHSNPRLLERAQLIVEGAGKNSGHVVAIAAGELVGLAALRERGRLPWAAMVSVR